MGVCGCVCQFLNAITLGTIWDIIMKFLGGKICFATVKSSDVFENGCIPMHCVACGWRFNFSDIVVVVYLFTSRWFPGRVQSLQKFDPIKVLVNWTMTSAVTWLKTPLPTVIQLQLPFLLFDWGVWKTENQFGFSFYKTELSKILTSVRMVFRQKLRAIHSSC